LIGLPIPGGQFGGMGKNVLAQQPFTVAALAPGGEVWFVDGASLELFGEDLPDFRQRVEPPDDLFAFSAVLKAGVELSANRPWQPRNFSDASHEFDLLFDRFQLFAIP
jgi:hypothetical protein